MEREKSVIPKSRATISLLPLKYVDDAWSECRSIAQDQIFCLRSVIDGDCNIECIAGRVYLNLVDKLADVPDLVNGNANRTSFYMDAK